MKKMVSGVLVRLVTEEGLAQQVIVIISRVIMHCRLYFELSLPFPNFPKCLKALAFVKLLKVAYFRSFLSGYFSEKLSERNLRSPMSFLIG